MYFRHDGIDSARPSLIFIHGIGESGLCFLEAFHDSRFEEFNIVVPDLPGFGKSSRANDLDYSFSQQINRMNGMLDELGITEFHLVGHSMGGIIGTQYCGLHGDRVLSFVNIEGDLTADNRFIVDSAIQSDAEGRFEEWLRNDFARELVMSLCHQWPSTVRYLASLQMCQSKAFLDSAYEIDKLIAPLANGNTAKIGKTYLELNTRRVFCWGDKSLPDSAKEFLDESKLANQGFPEAFHWVMLDQTEQFYSFLSDFLTLQ